MNNKGFTLIEVLAVVAIIAIVGIIATPSVLSMINTSKNSSYEILIDNIKTSAEELYQELDYMGTNIYEYDIKGRTSNKVSISSDSIVVNLQTLVGNGFLTGSNNSGSANGNNKVILEPYDNKDIGMCKIQITKIKNSDGDVCYKIEEVLENASECPITLDFGGR